LYDWRGVDSETGGNAKKVGSHKESDRKEREEHCRSVQETVREENELGGGEEDEENTGKDRSSQKAQPNIS
jgi:hypothetical protein